MNKRTLLTCLLAGIIAGCNSTSSEPPKVGETPTIPDIPEGTYQTELKVITANMWHSLTSDFPANNQSSYDIAVEELRFAAPDVLLLSEASGITTRLGEELGMYVWQGEHFISSVGLLSKYPIKEVLQSGDNVGDRGNLIGAVLDVNGRDVVVWSNHLDYTHYITYDARGGDGVSWAARSQCIPEQDNDELDAMNEKSQRPNQARHLITQTQQYMDENAVIIFGGDFNEPSGLDWTPDSAQQFDRKGTVHDFLTHRLLREAGYTDTYRELFPDPVTHPGASWPFHQDDSWMSGNSYINECGRAQDDRDRIDLIYYNADAEDVKLVDASLIGPRIQTYFPGPHSEDDTYVWSDLHTGVKVDNNGEPYYGEREFVSDHLWYSTSFTIETPYDAPQTSPTLWEPQFEGVELAGDGDDLLVSFELTNLSLWEDDREYKFSIMGDRTGARKDEWQVENLAGKPDSPITVRIEQETLQNLNTTEFNNAIQLRLRSTNTINGWRKDYAVMTLPRDVIESHVNIAQL
ncbi:endonuclease/exonuclease/phosphatase family protein [Photobacterium sp. DNB22_13_2]